MYQRIWMCHVGEKATTVGKSGNEHDQFAVAVLEDETLCTVSGESLVFFCFFLVVQDISLCRFVGGSALGSTISEADHPSGAC